MVEPLVIKYNQVDADKGMTTAASQIFRAVDWSRPQDFMYESGRPSPNILAVGYHGKLAVAAAAISEKAEPRVLLESDYTRYARSFLDQPYLAIQAIATSPNFRRRGYAGQIVDRTLQLAKDVGYHRVQAWVLEDNKNFWVDRHFKPVPYKPDSRLLAREVTVPIDDPASFVEVEPRIYQRLADFKIQNLNALAQRQR